ncbi:uncharacterized protein LODBEIA_P02430 [Lodderomyces beijingensis]|uniref:Transcription initiation factor TFIID subunit 1 histone acetyltransferase domain-containing protein n=1 Tax=Lodderomyces beijingensis TaxID=1775926 RepID=A0ABP0ZDQ8_9ASCO
MGHRTDQFITDGGNDAAINQYVSGTEIPDDQIIDSIFSEKKTLHADDAIDYEDIDELADDELPDEEEPLSDHQLEDDEFDQLLRDDVNPADLSNFDFGKEEQRAQEMADDEFDRMFDDATTTEVDDDQLGNLKSANPIEDDEHNEFDDFQNIFESSEETKTRIFEQNKLREEKRAKVLAFIEKLEKRRTKRLISRCFPDCTPEKPVDFFKFFAPAPKYYRYTKPLISSNRVRKVLVPLKQKLELDSDRRRAFKQAVPSTTTATTTSSENERNVSTISSADLEFIKNLKAKRSSIDSFIKKSNFLERDWHNDDKFKDFSKDLILSTTDWNDDEIINAGDESASLPKQPIKAPEFNYVSDDVSDEDIFDGKLNNIVEKFKLDMNDPNLLFLPMNENKVNAKNLSRMSVEQRFNISNDDEYELLRKNYNTKQRSQLSNLNIEHSVPALRLQTPFYKVRLTKADARSFHRPVFNVRSGTLMSFTRLKLRKKKKDKGKSLHEVFAKTTDLTTADTANIVALEYCEQYPSILSNFGMGSKLINYYRKEKSDDSSRPKAPIGETHVLGVEDRSPFWNFGEVGPGDLVPTLYNNMVRAPIFKHDTRNTDFLLVSSQGAGAHQKFYLRSINFNFTVGNVFPVEIPAPHSRKVTNISKNRLKMIVYRVMNAKGAPRIVVKDVSKHFPEQSDMQSRQRLKEFMEYQRQGDDQGFWKVRGMEDNIPTEEEIRAMITPEDSALMDTMQCGQQVLEDTAVLFGDDSKEAAKRRKDSERKDAEEPSARDDDEAKKEKNTKKPSKEVDAAELEYEEEMAPWNLSRNFVVANQTKAMLQLNGEGDPTGIGLGLSMLRASQRTPFKPFFQQAPEVVPKSNAAAHNQKLYESEIKRIWYSQRTSLVDHGPEYDLQQIYNDYTPAKHEEYLINKMKQEQKDQAKSEDKVLKITRRVRDANGILQRKIEVINDPRLIRAYVKRKKILEDELLRSADVDEILPTNDKELNKLRRKALEEKLANLEKRAKQSKAKKVPNDAIHAAAAAGATIIDANTVMMPDGTYVIGGKGIGKGKSTTRRCKSCGSFGHIRTNKTCPLYNQMIAGLLPQKPNANGAASSPEQQDMGPSNQGSPVGLTEASASPKPIMSGSPTGND